MNKRLRFDEKIENYLQQQINELKKIGISPVSRPMALRYIIEKNKEIMCDVKKKNKRKREVIIKLK